jgi:hypothetical protein
MAPFHHQWGLIMILNLNQLEPMILKTRLRGTQLKATIPQHIPHSMVMPLLQQVANSRAILQEDILDQDTPVRVNHSKV